MGKKISDHRRKKQQRGFNDEDRECLRQRKLKPEKRVRRWETQWDQ